MNLQTVTLRDPALTIPCPTRRRNIVDGDVVDIEQPYWARIAAEGDIACKPYDPEKQTVAKAPAPSKE